MLDISNKSRFDANISILQHKKSILKKVSLFLLGIIIALIILQILLLFSDNIIYKLGSILIIFYNMFMVLIWYNVLDDINHLDLWIYFKTKMGE